MRDINRHESASRSAPRNDTKYAARHPGTVSQPTRHRSGAPLALRYYKVGSEVSVEITCYMCSDGGRGASLRRTPGRILAPQRGGQRKAGRGLAPAKAPVTTSLAGMGYPASRCSLQRTLGMRAVRRLRHGSELKQESDQAAARVREKFEHCMMLRAPSRLVSCSGQCPVPKRGNIQRQRFEFPTTPVRVS